MQISLGNIYQSGGKTVVGGSQSGIDTEGLIKSLTEAKRLPAANLENKNAALDKQKAAYTELSSILTRFQTALSALRNPPGVQNASQNIFEYRTASLNTNNGSTASNYVSMTVLPGAQIQNFTISDITSLARETKQERSTFTLPSASTSVVGASGSTDPNSFAAGTFKLRNATGGAPVAITLNEGDSLQAVAAKFNDVKGQTGIQASVLKVSNGTPDSTYKIVFTSTKTGETFGFDLASAGTVVDDADGVLANVGFNTTQPASNATFKLDGVTITRETNAVNDLVPNITFTLNQTTLSNPGLEINATIKPDTEIVQNAITQFVDIYNEFRLFVSSQQQLGDNGLPAEDAVLNNAPLLRSLTESVANEVSRVIGGITSGNPSRLIDIGISLTNFDGDGKNPATKNIMTIDTDKLASALAANFDGVRGLFEFTLTSDNANLTVFSRTNALAASDITLKIDRANGIYQATYLDATNSPVTVDLDQSALDSNGGLLLKGKAGTALDGLQLIYASPDDATITLKATQGFGDRLFNLMDSITNTSTGTLKTTVTALDDQKARNREQIAKIDTQIVTYRDQLVNQYATLESALTKANQLLALLDAQAAAREAR